MRRANAVCHVTAVENGYNMINRKHEALIPLLEEHNIGWVAHDPLFKGLLSATFPKGTRFRRDDWRSRLINDANLDHYAPLLQYLAKPGGEKGATPAQLAIAWVLRQKPYIVPIPGMRKPERLRENMAAEQITFTEAELQNIAELAKS